MDAKTFCNQCGREATPGTTFCVQCGARIGASASTSVTGASAAPAMAPAASYTGGAAYPSARTAIQYGGFWIRVVAAIIDWVVVSIVVFPISIIIFGATTAASSLGRSPANLGLVLAGAFAKMLVVLGASWLYEAGMESSSKQATLGKMIFGMKVTDMMGNRISFLRATGRHFAKILSWIILMIGYIMVGFTQNKQGLHDMVAGTLVRRS